VFSNLKASKDYSSLQNNWKAYLEIKLTRGVFFNPNIIGLLIYSILEYHFYPRQSRFERENHAKTASSRPL